MSKKTVGGSDELKKQLMWEGSRLLELTVCVADIIEFCFCRGF